MAMSEMVMAGTVNSI